MTPSKAAAGPSLLTSDGLASEESQDQLSCWRNQIDVEVFAQRKGKGLEWVKEEKTNQGELFE